MQRRAFFRTMFALFIGAVMAFVPYHPARAASTYGTPKVLYSASNGIYMYINIYDEYGGRDIHLFGWDNWLACIKVYTWNQGTPTLHATFWPSGDGTFNHLTAEYSVFMDATIHGLNNCYSGPTMFIYKVSALTNPNGWIVPRF